MTFEQLNLVEPILKALKEEGYTNPTPIQEQTIPYLLEKKDVLGCAQTGTGKTAAFSIPILNILYNEKANYAGKRKIKALIVTPTRELAIQIGESFSAYGKYTGIKNTVIFGGVNQNPQTNSLSNGVDVLIATPGRLLDLIAQGHISLSHLEFFVLDEADRMLDMGFIHDVKKIITVIPKKRQSLFFSATMPPTILTLAGTILNDPEKVEVAPVSSTADTIQQKIYFVAKADKPKLLKHLLDTENIETVLVFTKTKHGADKVCKVLIKQGIKAEAIHGNKAQNARQRALTNFKNKDIRVLVATDIAARGIDVDELQYVINFDIPNISETYVHRIGRTGRAGNSGTSFSFCDLDEKDYLKDIQKLINKSIPVEEDHPFAIDSSMPVPKANTPKKAPQHKANFNKKPAANSASAPKKKTEAKRWYK
jgi:ATP-dependent RNA helicase RhlE